MRTSPFRGQFRGLYHFHTGPAVSEGTSDRMLAVRFQPFWKGAH